MKIGLFLTNQQFLDTDMMQALDEQIAMVHAAREHGWDSLFSGQHYLNEGNNQLLSSTWTLSVSFPRRKSKSGTM